MNKTTQIHSGWPISNWFGDSNLYMRLSLEGNHSHSKKESQFLKHWLVLLHIDDELTSI